MDRRAQGELGKMLRDDVERALLVNLIGVGMQEGDR